MPAKSSAQRELFAIAEHHPEQLHAKNKGLASLPKQTLHDFAATKGLPHKADGHMPSNTTWQQNQTVRAGKRPDWMERSAPHMADGRLSDAFAHNKGGLHRATGTPEGQTIPPYRVRKMAASGTPHEKKMADAAINMNPRHYSGK